MSARFLTRSDQSPASRSRRWGAVTVLGLVALTSAACGGGGSSPVAAPLATATDSTGQGNGPAAPPGAFGTLAAINGTSLEVQDPATGQVTVNYSDRTTFNQTVPATSADLVVGACVNVSGIPATATPAATGAPVTAASVSITPPVAGTCTPAFGRGGGRGGGFGGFQRSPGARPRPTGRPNIGARAFGKVSSVSGETLTVTGTNRSTGATTTTTVTLTSTTTFTKVVKVTASVLAVGQCITAVGPSDTTGAVSATSIRISTAGSSGCFARFGGGGGNG